MSPNLEDDNYKTLLDTTEILNRLKPFGMISLTIYFSNQSNQIHSKFGICMAN